MSSCILYQNVDSTVTLLDIPRSLESAQGELTQKIISSSPLAQPYPSVEPKTTKARAKVGEASIEDLLRQKHVQFALDGLKKAYQGRWCLPRVTAKSEAAIYEKKRKRKAFLAEGKESDDLEKARERKRQLADESAKASNASEPACPVRNSDSAILHTSTTPGGISARIPPHSTILCGDIGDTLETFNQTAPQFDLIVLDPPWPNRSARRKSSYTTSYSSAEIHMLLSSIPVKDHLAEQGLVAVWVTNKPVFHEVLVQEGGLFDEWGIELLEEWMWLKMTAGGEPICALNSLWRKPYEVLLIGRKQTNQMKEAGVKRRVIFAVPDLHSRKPNLKLLFEKLMGTDQYEALELFARNLTAGWWAWGNEVFKFQGDEYWADGESSCLDTAG